MKTDVLMRRIADRGRYPMIYGHTPSPEAAPGGWVLATDGVCALIRWRVGAWQQAYAPARMAKVLFQDPPEQVAVELEALRAWCGEPPVPVVMPCPNASENGEHLPVLGTHCYHDCTWIEGLGHACDGESRGFDPGLIAGIAVDRKRLAELLQCFPDGVVWVGSDGMHLHVRTDALRVVLCKCRDDVAEEVRDTAFGVAI